MPIVLLIPPLLTETISTTPTVATNPTYTGSAVSPTWNNYDVNQLQIGGTYSATTAGTYTATFTPKDGYEWFDGTTTAKSVNWTIAKANGSLSLSTSSVSLNNATKSKTVTITRSGNGTITATSSNTSVATVSLNGTTLTITGIATGICLITVNVAEGTNHKAPSSEVIGVSCSIIGELANASWSEISSVAKSGNAANYWNLGDERTFTVSGSYFYKARIVDFDHYKVSDSTSYGRSMAGITFQVITLSHETYQIYSGDVYNYIRNNFLEKNTLPNTVLPTYETNLRNVIVSVKVPYMEGWSSTSGSEETRQLFSPSMAEIYGASKWPAQASTYEGPQFSYYIDYPEKYYNLNVDYAAANIYWLRTPVSGQYGWCAIYNYKTTANPAGTACNSTLCIAPIFNI